MLDEAQYKDVIHTNTLDIQYSCPRWAIQTNKSIFDIHPVKILKRILDTHILNEKQRFSASEIRQIDEYYGNKSHLAQKLIIKYRRFVLEQMGSLIGIDKYISFIIGDYPVRVYIPYLIKRNVSYTNRFKKCSYLYIWPTYSIYTINKTSDLITYPSLIALIHYIYSQRKIYSSMTQCEHHLRILDTSGRYITLTKLYKYNTTLVDDFLIPKLRINHYAKDEIIPGPKCKKCSIYNTCKINERRLKEFDSTRIFKISHGKNKQDNETFLS